MEDEHIYFIIVILGTIIVSYGAFQHSIASGIITAVGTFIIGLIGVYKIRQGRKRCERGD